MFRLFWVRFNVDLLLCSHCICTNKAGNQTIDMFVAGSPMYAGNRLLKANTTFHCIFRIMYVVFSFPVTLFSFVFYCWVFL